MRSQIAANDEIWARALGLVQEGKLLEALRIFNDLYESGEWLAAYQIGYIHELSGSGAPENLELAAKWYRKAVFFGDHGSAHLALARMYFNNSLKGADTAEAFERHALAAAKGNEPLALHMLGFAFEVGHLVPRDEIKARAFYEKAAELGMVLATKRLALIEIRRGKLVRGLRLLFSAWLAAFTLHMSDPSNQKLAGLRSSERISERPSP